MPFLTVLNQSRAAQSGWKHLDSGRVGTDRPEAQDDESENNLPRSFCAGVSAWRRHVYYREFKIARWRRQRPSGKGLGRERRQKGATLQSLTFLTTALSRRSWINNCDIIKMPSFKSAQE